MIIEYEEKYLEDVKDLLVQLEEHIVSIDKDNLDVVGPMYREKMVVYDLEEVNNNEGKCFLYLEDGKAVGLIMGIVTKYSEADYLDYKCPKRGEVTELVVAKNIRGRGIGKLLMERMEKYFKSIECEFIKISVFGYNDRAIKFYGDFGYHTRMLDMIKKI